MVAQFQFTRSVRGLTIVVSSAAKHAIKGARPPVCPEDQHYRTLPVRVRRQPSIRGNTSPYRDWRMLWEPTRIGMTSSG